MFKISVVIPTYNEAQNIASVVQRVLSEAVDECLVVDGGSSDETRSLAKAAGAKVLLVEKGRAFQLNAGIAATEGNVLLFLHGDTHLPNNYLAEIQRAMQSKGFALGAFPLAIGAPGLGLRVVELLVRLRCYWFETPYGDQALFARRQDVLALGGFPEQPLMEDFEFVQRMKTRGALVMTSKAVQTSPRRWLKLGWRKTTAINHSIVRRYKKGASAEALAACYRDIPIDLSVRKNSESGERTNIVSASKDFS